LKVSGGTKAAAFTRNNPQVQVSDTAAQGMREATPAFQATLQPGDEFQTLTMTTSGVSTLGSVKSLAIRPTDAAGETFEIESVRLISQGDHSTEVPSGVGWQGLANVFRETIASRSPERFVVELDVPGNAWLDLH